MLLSAVTPRWELHREGDALYQEIVENAIVVTGARFVNLSWYDPVENRIAGSAWSIRPHGVMDEAMRAAQAIVPGFSPLSVRFSGDVNPAVHTVLVEGRPLLAPFGEHAAGTVNPAMIRIARTIMGLRWTYSVPLFIGHSVVGALAYHYVDRPPAETLVIADAFAQQAALTLDNARLSEALRVRAEDLERSRERIAVAEERVRREIADVLHGRVETRILVATERLLKARQLAHTDPGLAAAAIGEVADELDRIRDEDVRRASHRLHPSAIAIGLVPALEMLAEDVGGRIDVRIGVSAAVRGLDDIAHNALTEPLRLGVYRLIEGALVSAWRRARATTAHVMIDLDPAGSLRVVVSADGVAVPSSDAAGLAAMRDQVERLGGALEVSVAPAGGTTLMAHVPSTKEWQGGERRRLPRRDDGPDALQGAALFQRIVENALAVTGARFVTLSWYRAEEGMHELGAVAPYTNFSRALAAAQAAVPGFDLSQIRFRADVNPATRTVLLQGKPLLATLATHSAGTIHPLVMKTASAILGIHWTHSVPLRVAGDVAGALAFHFRDRPPEDRLPVAEAFAAQVALTLENARLSDRLREHAEELVRSRERVAAAEERTRREIAELLHGQVQTRLLVATHRLWEVRALLERDPAAADAAIGELAAEFDRIREHDVRQASRQLHPSALLVGLVAALGQLAESLGPRLDVSVEAADAVVALDDPRRNRIPEATRLGIYRFVEEALANVARHAGVGGATVHLDLDAAGRLRAAVSDRGRGFDPGGVRSGMGMRSMRDRVERLGGSLTIDTGLGRGTTVSAALPLVVG